MAQVLDRSRPFASVHGISDVKYEQDGLPFDHSGNVMLPASSPIDPVVETKRRGGRPKKVVDQVEANLKD